MPQDSVHIGRSFAKQIKPLDGLYVNDGVCSPICGCFVPAVTHNVFAFQIEMFPADAHINIGEKRSHCRCIIAGHSFRLRIQQNPAEKLLDGISIPLEITVVAARFLPFEICARYQLAS